MPQPLDGVWVHLPVTEFEELSAKAAANQALRDAAAGLADAAAAVATQPRAFHANEGGMQQALSHALAVVRIALRAAP